ncbi:MAG TPA: ATP-binding protein, partial [Blastocatellia bacterium]|nr:ATP-binding protein [Blastocatellia bacterium]
SVGMGFLCPLDCRNPERIHMNETPSRSRLARIEVLVIDDWAMAPLLEPERRDFWEICEDRYQVRSTILTSQLPVSRWHEQIGDPTLADGILDRWSTVSVRHRDEGRLNAQEPWFETRLGINTQPAEADSSPAERSAPMFPLGLQFWKNNL